MISRYLTQKPRLNKNKKITSDPQRHLVYHMERHFMGTSAYAHVELKTLHEVTKFICKQWRVTPPVLEVYCNEREHIFGRSTYEVDTHTGMTSAEKIRLNRCFHGDNLPVLAHELAHHILVRLGELTLEDHGPEFVGIYGWILDRLNILPLFAFEAMCDYYGVYVGNTQGPEGWW